MKKILFIVALCLMQFGVFAQNRDSLKNLAENTNGNKAAAMAVNKPGAKLPLFSIMQLDSSRYNTKNVGQDKNVVLILFNPGCEHCMQVSKMIYKELEQFPNTQFLLVAGDKTFPYLEKFLANLDYSPMDQMIIGVDMDYITPTIFAYEGIPQIMIYGKDKKLIDVVYKEITTKKLQTILKREKSKMEISVESKPQVIIKSDSISKKPFFTLPKKKRKK
jgi:thiol-disulfide isomerase/thioredoxin